MGHLAAIGFGSRAPVALAPFSPGASRHGIWIAGAPSPSQTLGLRAWAVPQALGFTTSMAALCPARLNQRGPLPMLRANQPLHRCLSWSMPNPVLNGLPCFF